MFKTGDFIIFGGYGVCEVTQIGDLDMEGVSKDRLYYTLRPYYSKGSVLYTPVDNKKEMIRPVMSREEAQELINDITNIDYLWVNDERKREREYKEAIHSCDCRELIKIIKTIYMRKKHRTENGKALTAIDKKYFNMAEDNLYGELAVSLGMPKEEVKDYIIQTVS